MGFETQEEAERWAENMEQRADAVKEERLLASAGAMQDAEAAWAEVAQTEVFVHAKDWLKELCKAAFVRGFMTARTSR